MMETLQTAERRFVTTREAARLTGISMPTLRRRVRAGHLTAYDNPRDFRVRLLATDELQAFLGQHRIRREEVPATST